MKEKINEIEIWKSENNNQHYDILQNFNEIMNGINNLLNILIVLLQMKVNINLNGYII